MAQPQTPPAKAPAVAPENVKVEDVKYELKYFDLRGRGEQVRLLLAYNKVKYTDTGVKFQEWANLKPTLPLQQVPVWYEWKGKDIELVVPQSQAILRHIARKFGGYGEGEKEHTIADYVADTIIDFRQAWSPAAGAPGRWLSDQKLIDEFFTQKMPHIAQTLAMFIKNNKSGSGYLVGASPTYADFAAFDFLDNVTTVRASCLSQTPTVAAFLEKIRKLESLSTYLANRRPTVFSAK
jgi:glutathione S-transferase